MEFQAKATRMQSRSRAIALGQIVGFTGDGTVAKSDAIDLKDIHFAKATETYTENSAGTGGTLTISDGTNTANLNFAGNYTLANFKFSDDGSGGALITEVSANSSTLAVNSGTTSEIQTASAATIDFTNASGTNRTLVLDDSKDFTGQVVGFTGDGTVANSDAIDLKDVHFATATDTYTENSAGTGGTLTISDGTNTANLNFTGNYTLANFKFSDDGSGGALITEIPANSSTLTVNSGTTTEIQTASAAAVDFANARAYPAGLESGDSQRSADERVWRP
jgi:hypothetical protein